MLFLTTRYITLTFFKFLVKNKKKSNEIAWGGLCSLTISFGQLWQLLPTYFFVKKHPFIQTVIYIGNHKQSIMRSLPVSTNLERWMLKKRTCSSGIPYLKGL
jgi:hypothetical protein